MDSLLTVRIPQGSGGSIELDQLRVESLRQGRRLEVMILTRRSPSKEREA